MTAVNYEMPIAEIVERLSGRHTCKACKVVYHVTRQPPKTDAVCDRCGGNLFQRDDDRPATVTTRMETYERSTRPGSSSIEVSACFHRSLLLDRPSKCARNVEALQNHKP